MASHRSALTSSPTKFQSRRERFGQKGDMNVHLYKRLQSIPAGLAQGSRRLTPAVPANTEMKTHEVTHVWESEQEVAHQNALISQGCSAKSPRSKKVQCLRSALTTQVWLRGGASSSSIVPQPQPTAWPAEQGAGQKPGGAELVDLHQHRSGGRDTGDDADDVGCAGGSPGAAVRHRGRAGRRTSGDELGNQGHRGHQGEHVDGAMFL
eukprot:CAMPEP_0195013144 /NCGR_PEP_ID=MMETSP0326_2-20130528/12554_1 /TAXON_ID=2866 ORGANISM="Crypthecodinium cohnii, Strain Seligo" /NCGR_SAMPLE_ID=MMETSP0326_2 /ASSEMBLY_ACC=CAM_ASM_000348 /LENGTH=207 /DNA_ID=CAMNT_0040023123 /DNA_START=62 /DNA_END=683 /DNA_ORIENTATION=-